MQFKQQNVGVVIFAAISFSLTAYAYANPGVATCALIDLAPLTPASLNVYVATSAQDFSTSSANQLVAEARDRIERSFGKPLSRPKVVFWDQGSFLSKIRLSTYGSTHFLGNRACVLVGPQGGNVDVLAHELVHAEVFFRVGAWARMTRLPTWFDEDLAMQVDHRSKYELAQNIDASFVRRLESRSAFFSGDEQALTLHYAAAKSEVKRWVGVVGQAAVYSHLERIRSGEPIVQVMGEK